MIYVLQITIGLIALAMPVLIGAGMLLTYLSAKDKSHTGIKTTGLSIIKAVVTIQLVLFCVIIGIAFLIFLITMIAVTANVTYAEGTVFILLGVFMVIILGGISAFGIIYLVKILSGIKAVVHTAETGIAGKKVSLFVPVVNIIMAVLTLFSLVMTIVVMPIYNAMLNETVAASYYGDFYFPYGYGDSAPELPQLPGIDVITAGSIVFMAAFLIMISIAIFRYRTAAANLYYSYSMYNYNAYGPDTANIQNSQPFSYPANPQAGPAYQPQIAQPQYQQPEPQEQPQNNSPFIPPDDNTNGNNSNQKE